MLVKIARVYIWIMAVILIINGLMWGLFPQMNLDMYGIIAQDAVSVNMIKSDIGGSLLAIGIISVLFLLRGQEFYLPLIVLTISLATFRAISIVVDGPHLLSVSGVIMEIMFALSVQYVKNNAEIGV